MSAAYMRRCANKKRHETREQAEAARLVIARSSADQVASYRCDQCLGWHVGRTRNHYVSRSRTGKRPNKKMRGRV
jgi:hypothetical protein